MTREEITGLVTALGDLMQVLKDGDSADKAEVYGRLGLTLTYHPKEKRVLAVARRSAASRSLSWRRTVVSDGEAGQVLGQGVGLRYATRPSEVALAYAGWRSLAAPLVSVGEPPPCALSSAQPGQLTDSWARACLHRPRLSRSSLPSRPRMVR
jgi:hypothetical protein